ncbi:MAG: cyclase family protein [Streptosporangiales bacterium]|nr:cyclase family protein [Streptosporangiales bacterium]
MQLWKHALQQGMRDGAADGRISRRGFFGLGTGAAATLALPQLAGRERRPATATRGGGPYTDDPVRLEDVRARWRELGVVGDERGTIVEVTPAKTTEALRRLGGREVKAYGLGEPMYPSIPAFENVPPRKFDLYVNMYGPLGDNRLVFLEERFISFTFQIASQVDELNHIGIDDVYYGNAREADIVRMSELQDPLERQARARQDSEENNYGEGSILGGTRRLGVHNLGPVATRGVLLDVLTVKQRSGDTDALSEDGETLRGDYRITIDDLKAAMRRGRIHAIEPGDVVLIRTGWSKLWAEPSRWEEYLATEPGIWLAEARWLADHRPAMVASDTWGVEVVPAPRENSSFEAHQLLITQEGIRLGEAFVSEELAADGVHEFVFAYSSQLAIGATAGNSAPIAIGAPR